ncbi:hypothetical protein MAR_025855 [Mya arenaria]|uniref:Uncharacterized protein n=1 Tax=Mya arenaria TaxID=6604 RepID=A0ABY7ENV6_MYAAR|nr:hypothetical protein MAR_025855 [Mya arenaria]
MFYSGISLAAYREATKNEAGLTFVCRPSLQPSTTDEDEDADMPTLERTMPVKENADDDSSMPSLHPSVLPDDSAYTYDTLLDDDTTALSVADMHTTRDEVR